MKTLFQRITENVFKLVEDDEMDEGKTDKEGTPICRHCKKPLSYAGQIACSHCGKSQGEVRSGEESHAQRFSTKKKND